MSCNGFSLYILPGIKAAFNYYLTKKNITRKEYGGYRKGSDTIF